MKLHFNSRFILPVLFSLIPIDQVLSQIYSKGITKVGQTIGFLDLKVVETDPVLKVAKETAPFDKPFFLKIKRLSKGESPSGTLSLSQTNGAVPVQKIEFKQELVPGQPPAIFPSFTSSSPSTITIIRLSDINGSTPLNINTGIYPAGPVYQETPGSEHIFIKIDNLKPEIGYQLTVIWDNGTSETYSFTTVPPSLDKRLKNRLSPQIGVTRAFFKVGQNGSYNPFSLMLGTYYQPRAVDPDLPIGSYKPFALQRFSLFFGLTINSMADGYIRDDLFSTSNLLTGIGYQPVSGIRLTGGAMIFREIDPNKLISNRKSIAATSYFGMTLDLKLKDLLGGIVTTLGFK